MENNKLKTLKGSERQIKFATDIRKYVLYQLEHAQDQGIKQEYADKVITVIKRTTKAKFIINTFVGAFYNHCVLISLDTLFNKNKELQDAKKLKQSDLATFSSGRLNNHNGSLNFRINDIPFNDETSKKNEIVARNTKIIENNLKYLASDIAHGYYSIECEVRISNAIMELKEDKHDVKEYQQQFTKLIPKRYIFEIDKRLEWLQTEPHSSTKIKDLADEIKNYISELERFNTEVVIDDKDLVDTNSYIQSLEEAVKKAKKFQKDKINSAKKKFNPWYISYSPRPMGDKLIRHDSAIEVIKCEKRYLSRDDVVGMEEVGAFNPWDDNRPGLYFFISYKNIDDTDEGKEMLQKYHEEKERIKKLKQLKYNLNKKLTNYINEYRKPDNFLLEKEFKIKYQDKLEKATKIYQGKEYIGHYDYLATYENWLFIAEYNGLDGDDWSYNNFANYCIWVIKLSNEQLAKLNKLVSELNKLKQN